jgi:hypothetical protein
MAVTDWHLLMDGFNEDFKKEGCLLQKALETAAGAGFTYGD